MRSMRTLSRSHGGKNAMIAIVIVLALIVSSVGAFFLLTAEGRKVQNGDTVRVDYIGQLSDGKVFDTSIHSVAVDNHTYPKSMFFQYRGNDTVYEPLEFVVGSGKMITGFNDGVLGMKVGERKTFVIPVGMGYDVDPDLITTINLTETLPVQRTMTISAFQSYFGAVPVSFTQYTEPIYGWDVQVLFVDTTNVMFQNRVPAGGADYRAYSNPTDSTYGWQINATHDGQGNIIVTHYLDAASALSVKGLDYDGQVFFVESVDAVNGTAVLNHNREVAGKELTFTVTVLSIS